MGVHGQYIFLPAESLLLSPLFMFWLHFDACTFPEGSLYISGCCRMVADSENRSLRPSSGHLLGRMGGSALSLGTLQVFMAGAQR